MKSPEDGGSCMNIDHLSDPWGSGHDLSPGLQVVIQVSLDDRSGKLRMKLQTPDAIAEAKGLMGIQRTAGQKFGPRRKPQH